MYISLDEIKTLFSLFIDDDENVETNNFHYFNNCQALSISLSISQSLNLSLSLRDRDIAETKITFHHTTPPPAF